MNRVSSHIISQVFDTSCWFFFCIFKFARRLPCHSEASYYLVWTVFSGIFCARFGRHSACPVRNTPKLCVTEGRSAAPAHVFLKVQFLLSGPILAQMSLSDHFSIWEAGFRKARIVRCRVNRSREWREDISRRLPRPGHLQNTRTRTVAGPMLSRRSVITFTLSSNYSRKHPIE